MISRIDSLALPGMTLPAAGTYSSSMTWDWNFTPSRHAGAAASVRVLTQTLAPGVGGLTHGSHTPCAEERRLLYRFVPAAVAPAWDPTALSTPALRSASRPSARAVAQRACRARTCVC